jgi:hypothetical protein
MNVNYSQSSGRITYTDGKYITSGWSGNGSGKNNTAYQDKKDIGPLPQGKYKVGIWEIKHDHLGPMVASLTQVEGESYGRSDFFIHGPSQNCMEYGEESKGCIVIPHTGRELLKKLNPEYIIVIN